MQKIMAWTLTAALTAGYLGALPEIVQRVIDEEVRIITQIGQEIEDLGKKIGR